MLKVKLNSLKSRIFVLFILLLIAVQMVSFFTTQSANTRLETQKIDSQLAHAETLLKNELDNRRYYLTAFAETVAKDYGLKQVLLEDTRSLLVALNNHRKRIDADIALAIDKSGKILAELLVKDSNKEIKRIIAGEQIHSNFTVPTALSIESKNIFYAFKDDIFQLVIAPIKNGDLVIGHIAFGYKLNNKLAGDLAKLTGFSVGFALTDNQSWHWLALKTFDSKNQAATTIQADFSPLTEQYDGNYIYANYPLGEVNDKQLNATTFQLRSNIIASVKQDGTQLLLMIALTLMVSLFGAYFIASGVTKPLRRLVKITKDIGKGDYHSNIYVGKTSELNQLAEQFEEMKLAIQARETEVTEQAFFDSLTALPNRNQFHRDMHGFENSFLLCQINIRRLSEINDTLGHEVGDEVIQEVANRLKTLKKPLYHTTGNGFLLRSDDVSVSNVKQSVRAITAVIEPSFVYQNISLHLQVNIGVTSSSGWCQVNQVLKEVDSATQIAKRKNLLFQLYNQQIDLNTLDRLQLVNRLKTAIENNEFTLYFQPKLNLINSCVEEVEALVRWQHPVNGLITPDAFIHIAEQTGQMTELSNWVINKALEQYFTWKAKGIEIKIAVNISPGNLLDDEFCKSIVKTLCGKRTLHEVITFEITEDAFVDHKSKAVENIIMLRKHGISLSIDDYGTGYSSLAQLKNLPVQELKIDRCFIEKLTVQPEDQLIVSSTIKLSHQLGLSVVAEGVENQQTLDWLTQNKCEKAQGYFISRPLPADGFYHWLTHSEYFKNPNSPVGSINENNDNRIDDIVAKQSSTSC